MSLILSRETAQFPIIVRKRSRVPTALIHGLVEQEKALLTPGSWILTPLLPLFAPVYAPGSGSFVNDNFAKTGAFRCKFFPEPSRHQFNCWVL
jgi:hypothetical protein